MDEMNDLLSRETWESATAPPGLYVVGCQWVYTMKYHPDETVDRYNARLVANGFTQTYGVHYLETFFPISRPNSMG